VWEPKLSVASTYTISITHKPCSHSYMHSEVKFQQFINGLQEKLQPEICNRK